MQHLFEIYLLSDAISADQWQTLNKAISEYSGFLKQYQIIVGFDKSVVRFFVSSDRDLSGISNNLEGIILRPVSSTELISPTPGSKERFVKFNVGGSLLDLKEKYQVKKGKSLELAVFKIRNLSSTKALINIELHFQSSAKTWFKAKKLANKFPAWLLDIDFKVNTKYLRKTVPKYLNIEKSLHVLSSDSADALVQADTFPYFAQPHYLKVTDYEFDKHSFIVGASGSGKSKFIALLIDRLQRSSLKVNYRVVVIDPHAAIADDLAYIPNTKIINFKGETAELFPKAAADVSAATELTTTLFSSLLADQFNPRLERVLRFSLFILFTGKTMSLDFLKRFLTELDLRTQVLEHVGQHVPENITRFFSTDFNEIKTQHYNEAIQPIVAMVDEMQLQPGMSGTGDISLAKTITDNFLTVFSLNKVSMGEKVVKTVAGLLMQQIFLLAQARAFNQRVILIVDEVSVVQNPALAQMLAEARKFNLTIILTQQYFGQIEKNLRDAILSNAINYYAFKVSEEDARTLEGGLNIELPKEIIEQERAKGLKEADIKVKIMTELSPRECLVRISAGGQINPAFKARTVDAPSVNPQIQAVTDNKAAEQKLATYKQEDISEFIENSAPKMASLTPQDALESGPNPVAAEPVASAPAPQAMNLSEILASQSSSNIKLKK